MTVGFLYGVLRGFFSYNVVVAHSGGIYGINCQERHSLIARACHRPEKAILTVVAFGRSISIRNCQATILSEGDSVL